ncbi:MAG TPA: hypothetical protein VFA93_00120 [Patescibacteria group bacterium]|nr:hypothetical protein [Patescibacteria group bacterium]
MKEVQRIPRGSIGTFSLDNGETFFKGRLIRETNSSRVFKITDSERAFRPGESVNIANEVPVRWDIRETLLNRVRTTLRGLING